MERDRESAICESFPAFVRATLALSLELLVLTCGKTLAQSRPWNSREFYRFVSSSDTRMIAMDRDGRVSWTSPEAGVTGRFQRATGHLGPVRWADYVHCLATNRVMSLRLFDASPPEGMTFIPGGMNIGTDTEFGAYGLTVEAFYMDRAHVTKTHWNAVTAWGSTNGYVDLPVTNADGDMLRPVDFVSWYDVVKWCNARSEREGRSVVYRLNGEVYRTGQDDGVVCDFTAVGYRLPTMVEWEYAARGGLRGKRYPWGDEIDASMANYDFAVESTTVAGRYPTNGYDLFDMAGNLWQWMWDWHPEHNGTHRAIRGGAWNVEDWACACGYIGRTFPYLGHYSIGFRTVLPDRKH